VRRPSLLLAGLAAATLMASPSSRSDALKDLYFGEALYHAAMGHYFDALQRLDTELGQHYDLDEPDLDSLHYHIDAAEFSVGDFELRYRMHHRAGRAIRAVLEGDVEEPVRNEAAFRLARIHFQKGQMPEALEALDRMEGEIPPAIRDDVEFLRANVYLATGRPADAVPVLKSLADAEGLEAFVAYNLGIAFLQDGQKEAAVAQLDRAGRVRVSDGSSIAIRDKANLVLGTMLLEDERNEEARVYLDRVSLDGPFSNQALLSAGWAATRAEQFERAVVPWSLLAAREPTDPATQEAMLALPYAYGKLSVHGRAAEYYGRALDTYGAELRKLDASILSIREGRFLEALVREEIRKDKDWVIRLRSLPESPETYYLMELMASHDFQTGLENYLDLADLRRKLRAWRTGFDAYDEMVSIRRAHYEPLLPGVDTEFRQLDSRMRLRLEQHERLRKRLQAMLTAPRPDFLATREERGMLATLERIGEQLDQRGVPADDPQRRRVERLQGRLLWALRTEYHDRLDAFHRHLEELDNAIVALETRYRQFVRVRQAASHSFEGYDRPLVRLRTRVDESISRLDRLMARQGRLLEIVAIDELVVRRDRLEKFQDDARYALADSYDRATQLQARRDAE
jgi:Flp pilus assembly protein TadD